MDIYPVPLPAEYFSAFSSFLYCCVWAGLSELSNFVVSLYCVGFSLWVGFDGWLDKVSWLEKLVSVFWWWSWISSLWSAMKCPVMSYEMSVGLV